MPIKQFLASLRFQQRGKRYQLGNENWSIELKFAKLGSSPDTTT
jgi:hypothetical protein